MKLMVNNMKLLREFSDFKPQIIGEATLPSGGKVLKMRGILQRADTLNQNGRVYPRNILERELRNYQKFINEKRALGSLDHTDSSVVELQTVCHNITKAWMDDAGVVFGEVDILPTPHGETLRKLIESGITVGISSRGVGSTGTDEDGNSVVQDDFQLICWDFVSEPSTPGAFMMTEGRDVSPAELKEALKRADMLRQSDRIDRVLNDILNWENK